ncbi:hypothetical protein Ami103574_04510 [Aminipila butyrica]|uniref:Uncharacterized protein n=1 Tax=Aminipila butyrica TaxID=433296 RepID=A0A858BU73_9FIRM|nr:hypothetical protein [Aminipila butyrica]QIB68625.1 hypothetical protein Ami103574_04510 [Aminipila butyrica]
MFAQVLNHNHIVSLIGGAEMGLPIKDERVSCIDIGENPQGVQTGMLYDPQQKSFKWDITELSLEERHDALSIQYIHEKYSYDDENKIMREYLSDMENETYKQVFEAYNAYVLKCKQKAYKEVYGEEK